MAATTKTITKIILTCLSEANLEPYNEPTKPPITIAITNIVKNTSTFSWSETPIPTNPESELTNMNTAAVAAADFTLAHRFNKIIGERKIPPPTPIKPLKNPIPRPKKLQIWPGF